MRPRKMDKAKYLDLLCQAYCQAPEYSEEEYLLERALDAACERFGLEPDEILDASVNARADG